MKKTLLFTILASICLTFIAGNAGAVPSLGVASDTGMYAYNSIGDTTNPMIDYFADVFFPSNNANEGFIIGTSGSNLTVWSSLDPTATQLYLVADTAGAHSPMAFGGTTLTFDTGSTFIQGQADGYKDRPYSYLLLPETGWVTKVISSNTFFLFEDAFTYTNGPWTEGYYMFVAANTNGTAGLQYAGSPGGGRKDDFSPKTTSSTGRDGDIPNTPDEVVPEPMTMLMFGLGSLGMGVLRRKVV